MTAFHGNPQLKKRLEQRARMIGESFSQGLRNLEKGQPAWQVQQHQMPLIPQVVASAGDAEARVRALESYGSELGIPSRIAFAQQGLFTCMHQDISIGWPLRFARALQVGADLSSVWRDFALFVLDDPHEGLSLYSQTAAQAKALERVIELYWQNSDDKDDWENAAAAAASAQNLADAGKNATPADCLTAVGNAVARTTEQFAKAFSDPSCVEHAIAYAGWPLRHMAEYRHRVDGKKYKPKADDADMVNTGDALWCSLMNQRELDLAVETGELDRYFRYTDYSEKLAKLIAARAPRRPGLLGRVLSSRLFGFN